MRPLAERIHGDVDHLRQALSEGRARARYRDGIAEAKQHHRLVTGHVVECTALDSFPHRRHVAEMFARGRFMHDLVRHDQEWSELVRAQDRERTLAMRNREHFDACTRDWMRQDAAVRADEWDVEIEGSGDMERRSRHPTGGQGHRTSGRSCLADRHLVTGVDCAVVAQQCSIEIECQ